MAKLILTDKEKRAAYLEWDDRALGKAVKKLAADIRDDRGTDALAYTACATMLACMAAQRKALQTVINLDGVTEGQAEFGDWEIVISRRKPEK